MMPTVTPLLDIYQTKEQSLLLAGKSGVIETLWQGTQQPVILNHRPQIAIVLHPHPLQGGTMHNKVVYTLARTYRQWGIPVLRFNFRGTGQSAGSHNHGIGETCDLLCIMQQIEQEHGQADFWLAGFSFGSFVAYQAYVQANQTHAIKHLYLVGPPTERYDYPLIRFADDLYFVLLQGTEDEIVNPEANAAWFQQLAAQQDPQAHLKSITLATGHFFHGMLTELKTVYGNCIMQQLGAHTP